MVGQTFISFSQMFFYVLAVLLLALQITSGVPFKNLDDGLKSDNSTCKDYIPEQCYQEKVDSSKANTEGSQICEKIFTSITANLFCRWKGTIQFLSCRECERLSNQMQ